MMHLSWVIDINFLLLAGVLLFIAWQDIQCRVISHQSLLFVIILMLPIFILVPGLPNLPVALAFFFVGLILFYLNIMGGGDVKLLVILSLALTGRNLSEFLFLTAFLGGFVAIFGFIFFRKTIRDNGVPYGVAITLAFLLVLPFHSPS